MALSGAFVFRDEFGRATCLAHHTMQPFHLVLVYQSGEASAHFATMEAILNAIPSESVRLDVELHMKHTLFHTLINWRKVLFTHLLDEWMKSLR